MKRKLLIIGAGGHGRVVADIAKLSEKYQEIGFADDAEIDTSGEIKVVCRVKEIDPLQNDRDVFVAIGDNQTRERLTSELIEKGAKIATLIHPTAVIAEGVEIGEGTVIMANVVINCGTRIGKGVIVNTAATVDHDNVLCDFVHISPGVNLAGMVWIDRGTWIGIGAVVSNNVRICGGCVIGAGATVLRDIYESGIYVGLPTKRIKS